jgi:hypothetical protein
MELDAIDIILDMMYGTPDVMEGDPNSSIG